MSYKFPKCTHNHLCEETGGICPIVGCPKELVNGPCGGVRSGGKCEVIEDFDCVWVNIYNEMKKNDELDKMLQIQAPRCTNFYADLIENRDQTS
ncbi:MAG: methylenetetrahydrofolate reductase C-terminal domain-containing protein [Nitrospiria bacterium]